MFVYIGENIVDVIVEIIFVSEFEVKLVSIDLGVDCYESVSIFIDDCNEDLDLLKCI